MAGSFKTYHFILTTRSPIFIGDGQSLSKKEYIRKGKVIYVMDLLKMYQGIRKRNLIVPYEDFMLNNEKVDLFSWLSQYKVSQNEYMRWVRYELDIGDITLENKRQMQMLTFIKDPYGCPYIPGSSLKGALRTVILADIIQKERFVFDQSIKEITEQARLSRDPRNRYLKRQTEDVETKAFNRLNLLNVKPQDVRNAVNDIMAGIRISDSKPLSAKNLVMCQKVDVAVEGRCRALNITRECIKPDTRIEFDVTIDQKFLYTPEEIKDAVRLFANDYINSFYKCFYKKNQELKPPKTNYIWLGGGVGYVSKTVIYNMMNRLQAIKTVSDIMEKTVNNKEHKHFEDVKKGISPHMLKCTRYKGKIYEMGQCAIEIRENKK